MDFDTEKFIIEVQSRPAIWNTKSAQYSNKNSRSKAWEELVDIYGLDLKRDKRKVLGLKLQKKWRNIRDAFVKAHKAKIRASGSAAKKKDSYIFYDNLLFLKDTININHPDGDAAANEDVGAITRSKDFQSCSSNTVSATKKRKKNNDDNCIGTQLVGVLSQNLEKKNLEDDDDRLFFLSLVKDFKKVPDHLQMRTKLDILRVINDAQQFSDSYTNTSCRCSRPSTYSGDQTDHYLISNPIKHMDSSEFERPPSVDSGENPLQNVDVKSPLSSTSEQSQNSEC